MEQFFGNLRLALIREIVGLLSPRVLVGSSQLDLDRQLQIFSASAWHKVSACSKGSRPLGST